MKAKAMAESIGYTSELKDVKKLEALYEGLELSQNDFFGNGNNLTKFERDYEFLKLKKRTDWEDLLGVVYAHAEYSLQKNKLLIYAGILQGVYFCSERPQYLNFGAIGWIIGREITRGFDDKGRHFDQDGNVLDWWQPNTSRK